jgi:hypothetical protein
MHTNAPGENAHGSLGYGGIIQVLGKVVAVAE